MLWAVRCQLLRRDLGEETELVFSCSRTAFPGCEFLRESVTQVIERGLLVG
jgi:hypothetical protein